MNFFQLILKQLRQRSLSTTLTILSVALGVALATSILIFQREGDKLFGQSDFGFDIILGPKGSKLNLVLNNVYQVSDAEGTIPYSSYVDLTRRLRRETRAAVPIAMGDNYKGYRLLGTQPKVFETPELAKVRDAVAGQFAQVRSALEPLRKKDVLLPFPANTPAFPKLFAASQTLRELAAEAGKFDPEARDVLIDAGAKAGRMVDILAAADRDAVVTAAADLEDTAGQALALLGGPFSPRIDKPFVFAQGRGFEADKFECVVGFEVAEKLGLKLGETIKAEHGTAEMAEGDVHDEKWTIVGTLQRTGTSFDRVILIPLTTFYAIPDHEEGLAEQQKKTQEYLTAKEAAGPAKETPITVGTAVKTNDFFSDGKLPPHRDGYTMAGDRIVLKLPKSTWKISSVLVSSRNAVQPIIWNYMQTPDAMAVNPATEMRAFTETFLKGSSLILLILAVLVTIVAAMSILVSIYNSIASRRREIAILRALGATKTRILSLICLEAGMIGFVGALLGTAMGVGLAAIGSAVLNKQLGQGINWAQIGGAEMLYFVGAVLLAMLAGLVPALKAYSTPVATHLVGE